MHLGSRIGRGRCGVPFLLLGAGLLLGAARADAQQTNSGVGLYPSQKLSHPPNEPAINRPGASEHLLPQDSDASRQGSGTARNNERTRDAQPGSPAQNRP